MIIEFCKTLAINLFWVLAAVIEVLMVLILVLRIISGIFEHLHDREDK